MLSFHACHGCVSCAVVLVEMSEVEDRKTGRRGAEFQFTTSRFKGKTRLKISNIN